MLARSLRRFSYAGPGYSDLTSSKTSFGVRGSVPTWINSFIRNRTQMVIFKGQLDCGVAQGSVIGPILFFLYTADITAITERRERSAHSYADDTQLYAYFEPASCHDWSARIALCMEEI